VSSVIVTGATTPLGEALVAALLGDPKVARVVAVGRPSDPPPRSDHPRLSYVATDLLRPRNLRNLLWGEGREADTIFHAAIHRSVRRTGRAVHALNVETTRLLLSLADERAVHRFVYLSSGAIYRIDEAQPAVIDEEHPVDLSPRAPQWVNDRVEADLTVCTRMGLTPMRILVMRFSECVAPHMGSQLHDYLTAPVCLRPLGFDPVLNAISLADMVRALRATLTSDAQGIFNIPGLDTLTLSQAIRLAGRRAIPLPGFALGPLYRLRTAVERSEFRYDLNHWRFHFSSVLSGRRARRELGYEPREAIRWAALR
jgi:UDP-glucose 4-epimerase